MNEYIDWSKAPADATGAMRANFDSRPTGGKTWPGKIEWVPSDDVYDNFAQGSDSWTYFPRPTWNGPEEGLPPVGLEIEFTLNRGCVAWAKGTVIGNDGPHQVVIKYGRSEFHVRNIHGVRPIRTPEQLAAEAHRAKYMSQLIKLWDADTERTEFLEAVYAMIVEAGKP